MQEYEQHLIGLGVKPGSKKEQRFHSYKKNKKGRGGRQQTQQGVYYQPMLAPQYMVQQPFFQPPPQGGRRGGRGSRRGRRGRGRKPGCLRISFHCPTAQGCTKTSISNLQDDSDCPRLADKTMVLGPGVIASGHPKTTPTHMHSAETTTEQPLPCQLNIPEPPCLVSWSSALQEHGFSAEVAERIAAPQRLSTRSIYASKWTIFQRWCTDKQVDFRNPSIGDICNFFGIYSMI